MIIYPAIDLRGGSVVRLEQGDFAKETVFDNNPVARAVQFERAGAEWLHIVDLDGARDGHAQNSRIVERIREETDLKIQLGGGIRSLEQMEMWLSIGIDKLVIGTLAITKPHLLNTALDKYGSDKFVVGLDARDGKVTSHGWMEESKYRVMDFAQKMMEIGVEEILYTDINRDGMLNGPDLATLEGLANMEGLKVIASGGISSYHDFDNLMESQVDGAIVGRALYSERLDLQKIMERVAYAD